MVPTGPQSARPKPPRRTRRADGSGQGRRTGGSAGADVGQGLTTVRVWLKHNALSVVLLAAFVVFVVGQALAGWQVRNDDLLAAGLPADTLWHYLGTGHFGEALFENWESEFLQMCAYVLLTAFL